MFWKIDLAGGTLFEDIVEGINLSHRIQGNLLGPRHRRWLMLYVHASVGTRSLNDSIEGLT